MFKSKSNLKNEIKNLRMEKDLLRHQIKTLKNELSKGKASPHNLINGECAFRIGNNEYIGSIIGCDYDYTMVTRFEGYAVPRGVILKVDSDMLNPIEVATNGKSV